MLFLLLVQVKKLYSVHVELPPRIALIHCIVRGAARMYREPCPMTFENTKLLAASRSAVEWYKSCGHISFLSEVIQILMWANST